MRIAAILTVCLLSYGTASAQEILDQSVQQDSFITSDSEVAKVTYKAGSSRIEVSAPRNVDVQSLLVAAEIRPNDDPQSIVDKVDVVRKRLYPNAEIALTASVPRSTPVAGGVLLYRYYILWNRRSGFWAYWNSMGAGVTFLGRVTGAWNYYECVGCSVWRFFSTVRSGGSLTRVNYGGYTRRGFNYVPGAGAKADIIMYFFY